MAGQSSSNDVVIGLNAVLAALGDGRPLVLCIKRDGDWALPYGRFDPAEHRTFEIGLRDLVQKQTQITLGFVEQLYTFGDKDRERPSAVMVEGEETDRIISVGYLGLTSSPEKIHQNAILWKSWYDFFPWEDWSRSNPETFMDAFMPALLAWAQKARATAEKEQRRTRIDHAFGRRAFVWEEENVLGRYELMYEAGIVSESWRDAGQQPPESMAALFKATGIAMCSDHRRILATAISRLRGKIRYRPIIFDLMPRYFTLLELQHCVEGVIGFSLHKQNFRRAIENSGLIEKTDKRHQGGSGRPAALFQVCRTGTDEKSGQDRSIQGLTLPRYRR